MLTELINNCFAEHWGEGKHTLEEIRHDLALPEFDPSLLLFLEIPGRPVGYVWAWANKDKTASTDDACAFIGDLGIRAAYRNRGLGRALLLRSLADLQARGLKAAELDVDGPNSSAVHLYESIGFYRKAERRWYRRQIAPSAPEAAV